MSAPVLPLDAARLNSHTSVGVIGAWMLYHDDETLRTRYANRFRVEDWIRLTSAFGCEGGNVTLPMSVLESFTIIALESAHPEEIERAMEKRVKRPSAFGVATRNAILRATRGEERPLMDSLEEVGRILARQNGENHASNHIHNIRPKFLPVAALWAAYAEMFDTKAERDFDFLPCAPEQVTEFLLLAENFRRLGETTLSGRREPMIPVGVSVCLPAEVIAALPTDRELYISGLSSEVR